MAKPKAAAKAKPTPKKTSQRSKPSKPVASTSTRPVTRSKKRPADVQDEPVRKKARRTPAPVSSTEEDDSDDPDSDNNNSEDGRSGGRHDDEDVEMDDVEDDVRAAVVDEVDLQQEYSAAIPDAATVKHEARDIRVIFSEKVRVRFKTVGVVEAEEKDGCWCNVCLNDKKFIAKYGKRKAFHVGGNSSLRTHIRQHYNLYLEGCAQQDLEPVERAMPRHAFRKLQEKLKVAAEKNDGKAVQGSLTSMGFAKREGPTAFTVDGVLESVAKFICCTDQSFATANNLYFHNVAVSLRPQTKLAELPSAHKVTIYIHNAFVEHLKGLQEVVSNILGKVASTADCWSAEQTKQGFLGVTGCWVEVTLERGRDCWRIRKAVIGFKAIHGAHDGANLSRALFAVYRRAGIVDVEKKVSKLGKVTLDNASNNDTMCVGIEDLHERYELPKWSAAQDQLMCMAHTVNLGTGDVMTVITKKAALETAQAIWDHDPLDPDNRVLGGSLDVIAALRTLTVKIQASGQRIERFEKLQGDHNIETPLKLIMHGNTRWGTAHGMVERGLYLRKAVDDFVATADAKFGPITTVRAKGKVVKKIRWDAFKLLEEDWARIDDARLILKDSNDIQQVFSSEDKPSLYKIIPRLEQLLTSWEDKLEDDRFAPYHEALSQGLAKIRKYYNKLDEKHVYVLALFIHPFLKLEWIETMWGGEEEQAQAIADGDVYAKNYKEEAMKIVETAMEEYSKMPDVLNSYGKAPQTSTSATPAPTTPTTGNASPAKGTLQSEYAARRKAKAQAQAEKQGNLGWRAELREYLADTPMDVDEDTDLLVYWAANHRNFPTIARIALDVIPAQASSVPCERLFSSSKQTASDLRSRIGSERFEELQLMKWAWKDGAVDFAKQNSNFVEDIELQPFRDLLEADEAFLREEQELGDAVIEVVAPTVLEVFI